MPKKKQITPNPLVGNGSSPQSKNEDAPPASCLPSISSVEFKPVGLYNLGNTCFFNSTLQALLATESLISKLGIPSVLYTYDPSSLGEKSPKLRDSEPSALISEASNIICEDFQKLEENFLDYDEPVSRLFPHSVNSLNGTTEISSFLSKSIQLLALMSTFRSFAIEIRKDFFLSSLTQSQSFSYSPRTFLTRSSSALTCPTACPKALFYSIAFKWPVYRRLRQQDAHEFLRLFLGFLGDEEEKIILKKKSEQREDRCAQPVESPYVLIEHTPKRGEAEKSAAAISPTIVNRVFAGLTASTIRCHHCNNEPFLDISLDLVPSPKKTPLFPSFSSGVSLVALLEKYFEVDHLNDNYLYDCEHCSRLAKGESIPKASNSSTDSHLTGSSEEKEDGAQSLPRQSEDGEAAAESYLGSLSDSLSSISISSQTDSCDLLKPPKLGSSNGSFNAAPSSSCTKKLPTFRKAEKWYRIEIFPEVLVLHLKRFSSVSRGRFAKSAERVIVPPQLDMSPFFNGEMLPNTKVLYELYALVIHIGSTMESGHYVAHVRMNTASGPFWHTRQMPTFCFIKEYHEDSDGGGSDGGGSDGGGSDGGGSDGGGSDGGSSAGGGARTHLDA
ncbi:hypothetical protein DI09_5p520 [Mitosporidium daphniae]|uniref:Ubiquitin carboxyl-terminal hydrolase n=1 Tax=Mitosporidium daphniae TaxID=1485682 RepID=A0A098VP13_9MICR|nr:uncharacterized protein DI09_5p520 [Mitosporidium daphniae]KGG50705.1 hypothetical protein DI09_5p520 [Mitosporidium daphniae]|eukprot:XP_013237132.1 uncharacterized protein DI09_5p520 [Mitosporidium daphniae]